jgi:putative NADPH-quinone reductase
VQVHAAVVIAHPCDDSFTHAVAERASGGLRAAGHDVTVVDLYAIDFVAAMTPAERTAYHGDQPIIDPMVAEHADLVTSVDALVFVYPTWWSGLPAILKGWLERVMVPGVGFRFDESSGKVKPGLSNIRHLIGVSTYGSPRAAVRMVNDNGRRTITRALRLSCGLRVRTRWHGLFAVDTSSASEREEFAASVERAMTELR